jgi:hypothetical protein
MYSFRVDPTHPVYAGLPLASLKFVVGSDVEYNAFGGGDKDHYAYTYDNYQGGFMVQFGVNQHEIADNVVSAWRDAWLSRLADAVDRGLIIVAHDGAVVTGDQLVKHSAPTTRTLIGPAIADELDPNTAPPPAADIMDLSSFSSFNFFFTQVPAAGGNVDVTPWYLDEATGIWLVDAGGTINTAEITEYIWNNGLRRVFLQIENVPALTTDLTLRATGLPA